MAFEKNIFDSSENPAFNCGPAVTYTGHMRREAHWSCPPHFHECAEILFCVDGVGSVWIDGHEYKMQAGISPFSTPMCPTLREITRKRILSSSSSGLRIFPIRPFPMGR